MTKHHFQCVERVPDNSRFAGTKRCSVTARFDPDADGNPTKCGRHSEAGKVRRKAKSDATWNEYRRQRDREAAIHEATRALEPALRCIANGANDPRAVAAEVLAALDAARKP